MVGVKVKPGTINPKNRGEIKSSKQCESKQCKKAHADELRAQWKSLNNSHKATLNGYQDTITKLRQDLRERDRVLRERDLEIRLLVSRIRQLEKEIADWKALPDDEDDTVARFKLLELE